MIKIYSLVFFFVFVMPSARAAHYYKFLYQVESDETFSSILKKFVVDSSIINAKTPLVNKIIRNNPHIKQWEHLRRSEIIELYISDDFIDLAKYKQYESSSLQKISSLEEKKKISTYPAGLKGSVFIMSSIGTFSQKAADVAEVNSTQNSPLTLGSAFTFYPSDKPYSTSFSAYLSYLLAGTNSLTSEKISVPLEFGGNIYEEYRWQKFSVTPYAGVDYERFSTFNLKNLQAEQKIYIDNVSVFYLTAGIAKSFLLFDKPFFTKFSISKSIVSTYKTTAPDLSSSDSDHLDTGKYSGYKFLFYLNYKFNDKIYLHTLFKYHTLSGPSELQIVRIGIGLGYILF